MRSKACWSSSESFMNVFGSPAYLQGLHRPNVRDC